jgi:hypothetical protein
MRIRKYDIIECEGEKAVVLDVGEPTEEFETDEDEEVRDLTILWLTGWYKGETDNVWSFRVEPTGKRMSRKKLRKICPHTATRAERCTYCGLKI